MKDFIEGFVSIMTAREPGEGYFGGAEGAIRFVLFAFVAIIVLILFWVF